jgi:tRNA-binding EMAP/Myf-like protein
MKTIDPAPVKAVITHDILEKIDVRVGTIETVDDVPKSNKLVKLTDTGIGCA